MAIFIDTSRGTESAVFQALLEIARCDPGLTGYQTDPSYVSVSYTQKIPGVASSNRLQTIVNFVGPIVIYGVDDTFQIDGQYIIDSGGWTFAGSSSNDDCEIYIDVSDAGGLHYCDPGRRRQQNLFAALRDAVSRTGPCVPQPDQGRRTPGPGR